MVSPPLLGTARMTPCFSLWWVAPSRGGDYPSSNFQQAHLFP